MPSVPGGGAKRQSGLCRRCPPKKRRPRAGRTTDACRAESREEKTQKNALPAGRAAARQINGKLIIVLARLVAAQHLHQKLYGQLGHAGYVLVHTGDARPAGGGKLAVVKAGDKHIARHLQAVLPQGDERACGDGVRGTHDAVRRRAPVQATEIRRHGPFRQIPP